MSIVRSADGTSIAYQRSGTGPPLVLVDAAGGYRARGPLRPLARLLSTDFTVFTYDRRGRGQSGDTLPYAVDREVDDIAALLAEAGGSAYLYGKSSGAWLALRAAARGLDVPRLAVFEPAPAGDPEIGPRIAALAEAGRRSEAVELFYNAAGVPPQVRTPLDDIAPTLAYDWAIPGDTGLDLIRSVAVPVLVLHSAASPALLKDSTAAVAQALPQATRREMAGRYHGVADEDLAPALTEYLLS